MNPVASRAGISVLLFCLFSLSTVSSDAAEPLTSRQRELVRMVRQDCGSCHGMTLQGGLGPALLPAELKDKPVEGLAATIYYGRPGTAMPPWQRFLNEAEAQWIAERLMTEFPQ
ncbi:cytochrome c [Dechloromonas sp. ZY10]|uniref:c-type cytochrome n=1 Tax=Dechloromonas aquae TaxID=2664436 RepID=UPI0035297720